jgi:hypothetical protein
MTTPDPEEENLLRIAREETQHETTQAHAPGPLRLERRPQSAFDGGAGHSPATLLEQSA